MEVPLWRHRLVAEACLVNQVRLQLVVGALEQLLLQLACLVDRLNNRPVVDFLANSSSSQAKLHPCLVAINKHNKISLALDSA